MRHAVFVSLLTVSVLLTSSPLHAVPTHDWSYRFGGGSVNIAYDVAVDGAGGVVVTGTFAGTMNFGGGPLTSAGSWDIFLARFDANGVHQWSRRFGGGGNDVGNAVTVDGAGGITITGYLRGPASFGGDALGGHGGNDIFVAKFDAAGLHQWSHGYGSVRDDEGLDVTADASGNVILTGHYGAAINFGAGMAPVFGGRDFFLLKLAAAGGYQWSKSIGSFNNEAGYGVAVDAFHHIFVTGLFSNTVNFGGGALTSAGSSDVFVAKYAGDGTHQWSARSGGTGADGGQGIGVDPGGDVVVTGMNQDAFLARYDTDGVPQWSQSFDSNEIVQSMDLAISPAGKIAITGSVRGTTDFGGGPLTSAGDDDIFLAVFEADGAHRWSQRFGNTGDDWGHGCAYDGSGNLVVTGLFFGTVDFGGGPLVSAGLSDIHLAKFEEDVADTTPPVITCPAGIQVESTAPGGMPATHPAIAAFLAGALASDDLDPAPGIAHDAPAIFPFGTTSVTFRATDAAGNTAECAATVSVIDTTPPQIAVDLDKTMLWPPNHKFVTVCAEVTVSDTGDGEPSFSLVSITSNEPGDGKGDGHTAPDIKGASIGTADLCFDLRAERSGTAAGRIYEIVYAAHDASGNAAYDTVQVRVSHDMSGGSEGVTAESPRSSAIRSVHPNPFNPQTTVEYILPVRDRVRIDVYDARGMLVRGLVDQVMPAGEHRVAWDGVDRTGQPVGSGIYFVKMTAGSRSDTRKIVLLK